MKSKGSFFTMPYKRKLFVYSVILSLVPVLILGLISSSIATGSIQEEVDRNHNHILKQLEVQVDDYIRSLDRASLLLANDQYVQKSISEGASPDLLQTTLYMMDTVQKVITMTDAEFEVTLVYAQTGEMYSSRLGMVRELAPPYDGYVKQAKAFFNQTTVFTPAEGRTNPELLIARMVPLHAVQPQGYLFLHLDINRLKRFIDQFELGGERRVMIVDSLGKVVMSKEPNEIGSKLDSASPLFPFWDNPAMHGEIELAKTNYSVSSIKSSMNQWTYIAMTPTAELTRKSERIRAVTTGIMLLLALVWLVLAFVASRRLYVPIQRLIGKFSPENSGDRDDLQAIDSFMNRVMAANEKLQSRISEQEAFRKESVLMQMLRGELSDKESGAFVEELKLPLRGGWFCVCLVDIDQFASFQQKYKEKDRFLMMYALRNMIEELCQPFVSYATVTPKPGQIAAVIGLEAPNEETARAIALVCREIRERVSEHFAFTVSVAISNVREDYSGICDSYEEAIALLDYGWVTGPNKTITTDQLEPSLRQSSRVLVKWKNALVASVKQGEFGLAREQLEQMTGDLPRTLQHSEALLGLFAYLIGELDHFLQEQGYELNDMFEYDVLEQLYTFSSLEEVREWIAGTVFASVQQHVQTQSLSRQKKVVAEVLQYIREHDESDLSLQILADHVRVSPSMLSRMFKEEMGSNYMDYVIQFRMDKAKEWLVHTEMSIKEITDRLRYASVPNFTRIFKQVTGMPPGNYRKQQRGEDGVN
ncbi:helix-turn-helix domain-containing protein [Paenibacillus contaminans]|nr:helix-turn-helix domain-containing protein [Paenibacillus contaminans]